MSQRTLPLVLLVALTLAACSDTPPMLTRDPASQPPSYLPVVLLTPTPSNVAAVTTATAALPASPLAATATHLPRYPLPPYTTPTAQDVRVPFADGTAVTLRNGEQAFTLTIHSIITTTQYYGVVIHYLSLLSLRDAILRSYLAQYPSEQGTNAPLYSP